ncbi:hypothetical protein V9T40_009359 [Parthenolecanium corni]|uniref:Peptidase A2 domain-containing protein n=1 Tax=Parthenolecanium corni TaxID=536013 RepID=A0AAN9TPV3_9HEMI
MLAMRRQPRDSAKGKLKPRVVAAASDSSTSAPSSQRLFIKDQELDCWFLIDSGSDISLVPTKYQNHKAFQRGHYQFRLETANSKAIET